VLPQIGIDSIQMHIPHPKDPAHRLQTAVFGAAEFKRGAGTGCHIGIARRVHDHRGGENLASPLGLHDDAAQSVAVNEHFGKKRVQEHLHMTLGEHLEEGVAEHLGIGLRDGSAEGVGDMGRRGLEGQKAIEEFLRDSADRRPPLPIEESEVGHAGTCHTTNLTVLFDEECLRAYAARGDGRDGTCRSTADHDDIDLLA
jgi:hypothetical protein